MLGVGVCVINYQIVLDEIDDWISSNKRSYICVAAVHLIMECQKDRRLLAGVNSAGLVTPDGMPLVWLAHLYGYKNVERVYGPTLMLKLCQLASQREYRVFLLGGAPGQTLQLRQALKLKFPTLAIVGYQDTPARPLSRTECDLINTKINRANVNIVFVGLGCPWQERWMIDNSSRLRAQVLVGVGAAFDFLSGKKPQAPPLVQRSGFEWLYRFWHEPRRLFYRYTADSAIFLVLILKQILYDFWLKRLINVLR